MRLFRMHRALCVLCVIAGPSCAVPIQAKRVGHERVYEELTANVLSTGELSRASRLALQLHQDEKRFHDSPDEVLRSLHEMVVADPRVNFLYVLAELNYHVGLRRDSPRHYLAAAVYAYFYLFGANESGSASPYDRRFRVACDLYNRGLARGLRSNDEREVVLDGGVRELPLGELRIDAARPGFPWGEELFSEFLPADEYAVSGLRVRVRNPGLGVPLIAVPSGEAKELGAKEDVTVSDIAATAFLRIEGGVADMAGGLTARLELYTGFDGSTIDVAGRAVPLETDLTTPLAHGLGESDLWSFGVSHFFSGRVTESDAKIFLLQPYQAGRIPIVFVHGTASSPVTWAEMFNTLLADPQIRRRYQFWFFMYPTGNPIAYSASILRAEIERVAARVDPEGADPALDEMVVIGHSQGGLLAKMVVTESGDALWHAVDTRPFETVELPEDQLALLRDSFFFEPSPRVERVVFMSTPHRGSFLAGNWIGRLFNRFVSLPQDLSDLATGLFEQEGYPDELKGQVPTSVRNMDPDNPFLNALADLPVSPAVPVNSIVAVHDIENPEESDDGVVEYVSAHFEGAESELIVLSGHSSQKNLQAILEVRRILTEHLEPRIDAVR